MVHVDRLHLPRPALRGGERSKAVESAPPLKATATGKDGVSASERRAGLAVTDGAAAA